VKENRMRPDQWLRQCFVLCFIQYFNNVGWITGRTSSLKKTCAIYSHRFSSSTVGLQGHKSSGGRKIRRKPANPDSPNMDKQDY